MKYPLFIERLTVDQAMIDSINYMSTKILLRVVSKWTGIFSNFIIILFLPSHGILKKSRSSMRMKVLCRRVLQIIH